MVQQIVLLNRDELDNTGVLKCPIKLRFRGKTVSEYILNKTHTR